MCSSLELLVEIGAIAVLARLDRFKLYVWQDSNVRLFPIALLIRWRRVGWSNGLDVESAMKAGGCHPALCLVDKIINPEA